MTVDLHPHQITAVKEMHNGCILRGNVGSGKSIAALAYYIRDCGGDFKANGRGEFKPMDQPRDLYIFTTKKKKDELDWIREAVLFGMGSEPESNVYGRRIVVDTWNSITKYTDIEDAFVIFDEQRLVGSGAWVQSFYKIAKKNRWVVLSATPGDTWMDFVPVFVANGFFKNRTEFIRDHVVYSTFTKFPKVDRYVGQGRLDKYRRRILVEMPYARHTRRHVNSLFVQFDEALFDRVVKDRWHIYEDRPIKDVAEMFIVMRRLVNTDISRLGAVMKIMEKHPKLIIFYNFNTELELLRSLRTTANIEVKEWNGYQHDEVPIGDRWLYLVQYTAGAEGWNCITTDATVFFSLHYSYKIFEQAQGRIDRMNTPFVDLWYYVIRSNSMIDKAIWRALAGKKKFHEKGIGEKLWNEQPPS